MEKLISKVNQNNYLLLKFNNLKEEYFNSLKNVYTNKLTPQLNVETHYFDDEEVNVIRENIFNEQDELMMVNYKSIDIINSFHISDNTILELKEDTQIDDSLEELYELLEVEEKKNVIQYIFHLEKGVQCVLIKNVSDTKYLMELTFTRISKDKLAFLISKYVKKFSFYFNLIDNIFRYKFRALFRLKYITELNRVLNKPATLQRDDIPKIALNYTITDKADGERHLLFIDKYGSGYLINNKFEIKQILQLPFKKLNNCIIDGEYVIQSGDKPDLYLIFDIIEFNGASMLKKRFNERMKYLNELSEKGCKGIFNCMNNGEKVNIRIKQFYMLKDYLDTSGFKENELNFSFLSLLPKSIYSEKMIELWQERGDKFSYLLDGLILTPLNGMYVPEDRTFLIYKWKDHHTIDVRVVESDKEDNIWKFDVNKKTGSKADFIEGYTYNESKNINAGDVPYAEGDIVEFIWSAKQNQFIPLRLRDDKIVPNARKTVEGVIKAIEDDIKPEELFNINETSFETIFYQEKNLNKVERAKSTDYNLKLFHNYIKNELIKYPGDNIRGNTLLDLAAGKGGDINKWLHSGYKNIVACDIVATALEEFNKRIIKLMKNKKTRDMSITLFNTDSTKDLITGKAGMTPEEQYRLKTYFSNNDGKNITKFSKIVCNFAISYMFSDNNPLATGFFNNVKNCLDENGYFVGTIIDGDILDKAFITDKKEEIVAKTNGEIFYIIKPLGEYKAKSSENQILVSRPGVGGWANPIPEPVIYPSQIEAGARKMGFTNIIFTEFEKYYDKFVKEEKVKMSEGEKLISFLHKTFIISF